MPSAEFKPATAAIKWIQTYALYLTTTGIGNQTDYKAELFWNRWNSYIKSTETSFDDFFYNVRLSLHYGKTENRWP